MESVAPLGIKLTPLTNDEREDTYTTDASDGEEGRSVFSISSESFGTVAISVGDSVILQGLQSSPELNGRNGTILRILASSEMYEVKVQGCVTTKAVKSPNLSPCMTTDAQWANACGYINKKRKTNIYIYIYIYIYI